MSKCIGGIAHEAVGLATHQPSKSFGELFEENGKLATNKKP